jgi:ABC-type polysaccharide/polyol phosphate export permease
MRMNSWINSARAKDDLRQSIRHGKVWMALAVSDIRSKYRVSVLGSLWITMATGAIAVAIGITYGQFFGQTVDSYLPYFTASYITWVFISSTISESSTSLITAGHLIKSSHLPIVFHVLRMLQRNLIVLAHNALVLIGVWVFLRWEIGPQVLLAVLGLALLYFFLAGVSVAVAIVCVRYRDLPSLVQVFTQFLFFVSPVIWQPERVYFGAAVLALNPLSYMLMVVRDPILGRPVAAETWLIASCLTLAMVIAGALMYIRFRNRIAYWV